MDKLEKVNKGFDVCKNLDGCCDGCPYFKDDINFGEDDCMRGQLMIDAIELLKEQKNLIDGLIEDQLKKDEEQQAEIERLKSLVKKKNRKIKKLMEDNYLNGGR